MKRLLLTLLVAALSPGCRCNTRLQQVEPGRLMVNVTSLKFPDTFVGARSSLGFQVSNGGEAELPLQLSVTAPFSVTLTDLSLAGGESREVTVDFAPGTAENFQGAVTVLDGTVSIEGTGLAVPECRAPDVCHLASFDSASAVCITVRREEGSACETQCVVAGECRDATCRGQARDCDDANVCTVDGCGDELGCSHAPVQCAAPPGPCQLSRCAPGQGCLVEDRTDGILCGPDDCKSAAVSVCIAGQCVVRVRPDDGRCVNRWIPDTVFGRRQHALAFDAARGRMVLFGGLVGSSTVLRDTWEWDGATWIQRTPATSPPARFNHAMAFDAVRGRVVLFGGRGTFGLDDTWEWDGTTWLQRTPMTKPASRDSHAMAWDPVRKRVVLFGGSSGTGTVADTWEWDGNTWLLRAPVTSPPPRAGHAMATGAGAQHLVLFGGSSNVGNLPDTWTWDGSTWTEQHPSAPPPARAFHVMAFDPVRARVILFSGLTPSGGLDDTWEWDGSAWAERLPPTSPSRRIFGAMAFDTVRRQAVLFGGSGDLDGTWAWNGTTWAQQPNTLAPPARAEHAMAYDAARKRVVLFGGYGAFWLANNGLGADTWEWDGSVWRQRFPIASPPARSAHAMAYDPVRQRVVLFGGRASAYLNDTWEWDGTTWLQRPTPIAPSARARHAMAYDAARQRLILFGGGRDIGTASLGDTWAWDGTQWQQLSPPVAASAREVHAMAYDPVRQRVVLSGGLDGLTRALLRDTWGWDGVTWAKAPGNYGNNGALAFDESRQTVAYLDYEGQTSDWDGGSWTLRMPNASPPEGLYTMAFDSERQRLVAFGAGTWIFLP